MCKLHVLYTRDQNHPLYMLSRAGSKWVSGILAVVEILTATLPLFKQVSSSHFPLYRSLYPQHAGSICISLLVWILTYHIQLCLAGLRTGRVGCFQMKLNRKMLSRSTPNALWSRLGSQLLHSYSTQKDARAENRTGFWCHSAEPPWQLQQIQSFVAQVPSYLERKDRKFTWKWQLNTEF